jgi:hypothetical protein
MINCSVRYFCCGALLIFVGSVMLCAFGFTYVLPYQLTNTWPQAVCHVVGAFISERLCACDKHTFLEPDAYEHHQKIINRCTDSFPCVQVATIFNITQTHLERFHVLRNYTNSTLIQGFIYRSWSDAFFKTVRGFNP